MSSLFINSCVREKSRTMVLARTWLNRLAGDIQEINLQSEGIMPLDSHSLALRERLIQSGDFSHPIFRYAREFSEADTVIIASPFWDLSFPSLLKVYFEAITVCGITFKYEDGMPEGLCHAKNFIYITASGGPIMQDFGFPYVKALAETFYGIKNVKCFQVEGLDIDGADESTIMNQAIEKIKQWYC